MSSDTAAGAGRLEQRIRELVAAAPPLSERQRRRLRLLLNPAAPALLPQQPVHKKAVSARTAETALTERKTS